MIKTRNAIQAPATGRPIDSIPMRLAERRLETAESVLAVAGVSPCEEKCPFPRVAGQRGRSLEFRTRLGQSAGPEQKVAPRRRQWRVVAQGGGGGDLVHQSEAASGPKAILWAIARLRSTTGEGATTRSRS